MKILGILTVLLLFTGAIILTGCGEQAGEAYKKFRKPAIKTTTVTPIKALTCTYREGTPACSGDIIYQKIQKTDCTTETRKTDCRRSNMICDDGECVKPCRTMSSAPYCDGSYVKHMETDSRCDRRTMTDENCADTGRYCVNGTCQHRTDAEETCEISYDTMCLNVTHMMNTTTLMNCSEHNFTVDCSATGGNCTVDRCVW